MNKRGFFVLFVLVSLFLSSCKKDTLLTSSSAKLSFSTNQLDFDTVFTTIGSTVQAFLVRNTHNQPIEISSVKLAGSYTSPFKINIDGVPGTSFSNIKIPANDSIFVFVTVTIDPTNKNNPIVIEDSLVFTTNGNLQSVGLEAWGQDAHFFKPNVFPPNGPAYSIIPCGANVWANDKPYVIYGYLIDTCSLTIEPGVQVYMHATGNLYVASGATLKVLGSPALPVTFQGDRLEQIYQAVPGQWGEIQLSPGSINNLISWAVIKNGTVGVEADTVGNSSPTLKIDHTIIKSMSEFGLLGLGSNIVGDDILVEDCQYYCVNISYGGACRFNQCTFANYWSYAQRQSSLLNLNNYYVDVSGKTQSRNLDSALFYNCIVYGTQSQEINFDIGGSGFYHYYFGDCLLKTATAIPAANNGGCNFNPNLTNSLFISTAEPPGDNYQISGGQPAFGMGSNQWGLYTTDLSGATRGYPSTAGAYQN